MSIPTQEPRGEGVPIQNLAHGSEIPNTKTMRQELGGSTR